MTNVEAQPQGTAPEPQPLRWFALRVFNNRIQQVKEELEALGVRTYQALRTTTLTHDGKPLTRNGRPVTRQIQLAPSLLFVHWDASRLKEFKQQHFTELMLYRKSGSQEPAPIPDREMEMFILVTTAGDGSDPGALQLLEPAPFDFKPGEKVRVIEGPFKGAEGIIRRIKKDRKLLVAVQGVVVVAISHIPAAFLERLPASGENSI